MLGPGIPRATIGSRPGPPIPSGTPIFAIGLGVGSSPPPGSSPATALAGARRDRALDSSGMTPGLVFLSHEPNVSKYRRGSRGMCCHKMFYEQATSRRLLRYKAHRDIKIDKTRGRDFGVNIKLQFITNGVDLPSQ